MGSEMCIRDSSGTALGVLGAGVAVHLSAQLVRFRQAARRQGERRPGR